MVAAEASERLPARGLGPELGKQYEAMAGWVLGAEGLRRARALLSGAQLTSELAQDLQNETAMRLLVTCQHREQQGKGAFDELLPERYAARAMRHVRQDLLRSERRKGGLLEGSPASVHEDGAGDQPNGTWLGVAEEPLGVPEEAVDSLARVEAERACRQAVRCLLAAGRTGVAAGACALAYLTFACHPEVALPAEAPRPEAGGDQVAWVALWAGMPEPPSRRTAPGIQPPSGSGVAGRCAT